MLNNKRPHVLLKLQGMKSKDIEFELTKQRLETRKRQMGKRLTQKNNGAKDLRTDLREGTQKAYTHFHMK